MKTNTTAAAAEEYVRRLARTAELVGAVRQYAVKNYERGGWDYVVECWGDDDIASLVRNCRTPAGAIAKVRAEVAPLAGQRSEAVASYY